MGAYFSIKEIKVLVLTVNMGIPLRERVSLHVRMENGVLGHPDAPK